MNRPVSMNSISRFGSRHLSNIFTNLAVAAAAILVASPAIAQQGGGSTGGGDGISCATGAMFYDVFEASTVGLKLDFGPQGTYLQKISYALSQMARLDHHRAEKYLEQAKQFESETKFVQGDLVDVADTGIGYVPKGCALKQLAIQNLSNMDMYGKRYLVDEQLWNRLDANNKAALVLHELLYREYGPGQTSIEVRKFNELIWSGAVRRMSLKEYVSRLIELRFKTFDDQNGFECKRELFDGGQRTDEFYSDDRVQLCVTTDQTFPIMTGRFFGALVKFRLEPPAIHYSKQPNVSFLPLGAEALNMKVYSVAAGAKTFSIPLTDSESTLTIDWSQLTTAVRSDRPLSVSLEEDPQGNVLAPDGSLDLVGSRLWMTSSEAIIPISVNGLRSTSDARKKESQEPAAISIKALCKSVSISDSRGNCTGQSEAQGPNFKMKSSKNMTFFRQRYSPGYMKGAIFSLAQDWDEIEFQEPEMGLVSIKFPLSQPIALYINDVYQGDRSVGKLTDYTDIDYSPHIGDISAHPEFGKWKAQISPNCRSFKFSTSNGPITGRQCYVLPKSSSEIWIDSKFRAILNSARR